MSTRKVFSLIGLCLTITLIIGLFIPYYDFSSIGGIEGKDYYSIWRYLDDSDLLEDAILFIVSLSISLLAFILQLCGATKDSKLAYLGVGYFFFVNLSTYLEALNHDGFNVVTFGFWYNLIISTFTVIIIFVGNLLSNERRKRYVVYNTPITGYDPVTGKPIYAKQSGFDPVTGKPVFAQPSGYDSVTGQPIYDEK